MGGREGGRDGCSHHQREGAEAGRGSEIQEIELSHNRGGKDLRRKDKTKSVKKRKTRLR